MLNKLDSPVALLNMLGRVVMSGGIWFIQSPLVLIVFSYALLICQFTIPGDYSYLFHTQYTIKGIHFPLNNFFIFCTFIFFFLLPYLFNKFVYKKDGASVGLCLPPKKLQAIFLSLGVLAVLMPVIIYLSSLKSFHHYYDLDHPSTLHFLYLITVIGPLYYFFEEFYFRGFLLMNLQSRLGWHSYWITDIIFVMAHFTKLPQEVMYALFAGILLAFLTLRTKSILPAMFVHYCLGVTMLLGTNYWSVWR